MFNDKNNYLKIQAFSGSNRLGLIAIDEVHLVYDWQDFRQLHKKCEELHEMVPKVPLMALSATVTPQIENVLKSFMHDPLVERSSVNHCNVYLAAKVHDFKRVDRFSNNLFH